VSNPATATLQFGGVALPCANLSKIGSFLYTLRQRVDGIELFGFSEWLPLFRVAAICFNKARAY
jgi:hypothetical protein